MRIYLNNGDEFIPSKNELLTVLLYLKGVFAPNIFKLFETGFRKRDILVESFEKPYLYMEILSENKNYPDFNLLDSNLEKMSFADCAQYMMFYLRLAKGRGGDFFISMWKRGSIEMLIDRMLINFDSCTII